MSRHRVEPPLRVRPRPGRIVAALTSVLVTGVALLGGLGLLPLQQRTAYADAARGRPAGTEARAAGATPTPAPAPSATTSASPAVRPTTLSGDPSGATAEPTPNPESAATQLPSDTGVGKRVVFDISAQRVWLVDDADEVVRTYLVSGSLTDNLKPGDHHVYSRSRWAVGVDDSGVMQYFVRFAHGRHAAIGFHSIPTKHGHRLQSVAQLGTPQSHGCIRQRLADARRMWRFAPVGTDVRVIA
jgi:lipoprotein-anchoring transpeptidase ErfK/SrfK